MTKNAKKIIAIIAMILVTVVPLLFRIVSIIIDVCWRGVPREYYMSNTFRLVAFPNISTIIAAVVMALAVCVRFFIRDSKNSKTVSILVCVFSGIWILFHYTINIDWQNLIWWIQYVQQQGLGEWYNIIWTISDLVNMFLPLALIVCVAMIFFATGKLRNKIVMFASIGVLSVLTIINSICVIISIFMSYYNIMSAVTNILGGIFTCILYVVFIVMLFTKDKPVSEKKNQPAIQHSPVNPPPPIVAPRQYVPAQQPVPPPAPKVSPVNANANVNVADEFKKYKELFEQGVISEEEFNNIKSKLIDKI